MQICDPHFHFWSASRPNPNLGGITQSIPDYGPADLKKDFSAVLPSGQSLSLVSGVHVETVVGQCDGGHKLDTVGETKWVDGLLTDAGLDNFNIVAFVHLGEDNFESVIAQHRKASKRFVGVRMILNHSASIPAITWPQVDRDWTDLLNSRKLASGLTYLQKEGLSFDLHCNPHQLLGVASVLQELPDLYVVVDHLGCLRLNSDPLDGSADEASLVAWREGLVVLSKLPRVYMKLSSICCILPGWEKSEEKQKLAQKLVLEVIDLFGAARCMVASNYPVDKFLGSSITDIYGNIASWVSHLSAADQTLLFHDTAASFYKLPLVGASSASDGGAARE